MRLCSNFLFLWEHQSSSSRAHPYNIIFTLIIPFNVQSPNIVTFKVLGVRAWTNEFVSGGHTIHYTILCLSLCVVSLNCSFTFLYGFLLFVAFFFFNLCTFEKSAFWVLQLLSLQETWRHLVKNQEMLPSVRRVPSCQGSTVYLGIRGKTSRCLKVSLDELILLVFFLSSFLSLPFSPSISLYSSSVSPFLLKPS